MKSEFQIPADKILLSMLSHSKEATVVFVSKEIHIGFINQEMLKFWNKQADVLSKRLIDVAAEFAAFVPMLQEVWETGVPYIAVDRPVKINHNGQLLETFFDFEYRPVMDDRGQVYAIINSATDVTERMQAKELARQKEEKLEEANIRLQFAMEAGSMGTTEVEFASGNMQSTAQFKKNYGRSPDETFNYADLFNSILAEYREPIRQKVLKAIETNGIYTAEYPVRWPDGTFHWIAAYGKPRYDSSGNATRIVGLTLDITDRVTARQAMESSEAQFRKLVGDLIVSREETQLAIDAASMATFDLDPVTGKFKGNHLVKEWFGLDPEDDIELSKATDVIAPADRERVIAAIGAALQFRSGGDYEISYSIINPHNTKPRIVKAKGKALFNKKGEAIRLSGVLQDVTEQQEDERRKNDFIAMVSHELKTPLTSLLGYVQLLQLMAEQNEDKQFKELLEKAKIQVRKMNTMIAGFLDMSRFQSGKIHLQKQSFLLTELIAEIISDVSLLNGTQQINYSPNCHITVNADKEKISQVITNLLSNALKYSPRAKKISVNCSSSSGTVTVAIKDEGIGIRKEDQDKLFNRFYRVEDNQTATISGFGIGLYVSAEIITRHGGRIWVESEPGKGATFYFSIASQENQAGHNNTVAAG